jgi:hypothetical protein
MTISVSCNQSLTDIDMKGLVVSIGSQQWYPDCGAALDKPLSTLSVLSSTAPASSPSSPTQAMPPLSNMISVVAPLAPSTPLPPSTSTPMTPIPPLIPDVPTTANNTSLSLTSIFAAPVIDDNTNTVMSDGDAEISIVRSRHNSSDMINGLEAENLESLTATTRIGSCDLVSAFSLPIMKKQPQSGTTMNVTMIWCRDRADTPSHLHQGDDDNKKAPLWISAAHISYLLEDEASRHNIWSIIRCAMKSTRFNHADCIRLMRMDHHTNCWSPYYTSDPIWYIRWHRDVLAHIFELPSLDHKSNTNDNDTDSNHNNDMNVMMSMSPDGLHVGARSAASQLLHEVLLRSSRRAAGYIGDVDALPLPFNHQRLTQRRYRQLNDRQIVIHIDGAFLSDQNIRDMFRKQMIGDVSTVIIMEDSIALRVTIMVCYLCNCRHGIICCVA